MNRVNIENTLRPVLQNLGIVGKRGPVPSWVLPATLAVVILLVLILTALVKIYELVKYGTCPMCGSRHVDTINDKSGVKRQVVISTRKSI
jgi:hypothetical protein